MKELQVTFYDVISILLPASLVLSIIYFHGLFHSALISRIVQNVINASSATEGQPSLPDMAEITITFVVAYLLGHAINQVTKHITHSRRFKRILVSKSFTHPRDPDRKMVFCSDSFPVVLDRKIGQQILHKIFDFYGIEFSEQDQHIKAFLEGTLPPEQMNKHGVFIAVACMMRNTAFLGLLFALYFVYEVVYAMWVRLGTDAVWDNLLFICAALASYVLFRRGYKQYQKYAGQLIFYSFLTAPNLQNSFRHQEQEEIPSHRQTQDAQQQIAVASDRTTARNDSDSNDLHTDL